MRSKIILLSATLLGIAGGYYVQHTPEARVIAATLTAPDFSYTTLEGETHKLSNLQGKVVLVHFWASWCQPCKLEFPALLELARNHPDNLVILAFSVDDAPQAITRFVKDESLPKNFSLIWDEGKKISRDLFQTVNYPETILVGCNRQMEDKIIGMAEDWETIAKPLLKACR